jgi:hypothetical protein
LIAKISKGSSGRGLVRYLFGPGKANEHTDQRVVATGVSLWAEEGRALSAQEITDLGANLDAANDAYRVDPDELSTSKDRTVRALFRDLQPWSTYGIFW